MDTLYICGFDGVISRSYSLGISVGIENYTQLNAVTVYPNPASDQITIISEQEITNVKIYNSGGQLIFEKAVNVNLVECNISKILTGMYFLRIETTKKTHTQRMIIK